jgi:hypothetical protein
VQVSDQLVLNGWGQLTAWVDRAETGLLDDRPGRVKRIICETLPGCGPFQHGEAAQGSRLARVEQAPQSGGVIVGVYSKDRVKFQSNYDYGSKNKRIQPIFDKEQFNEKLCLKSMPVVVAIWALWYMTSK